MRPFIVVGDRTDHGGTVVGSSPVTDTHGKQIARVGDRVTCPKKGHGHTVIVTGDPTTIIDGQPVARHGDKCSCGATLLASQVVTGTHEGAGAHGGHSPDSEGADKQLSFDFDEQVELLTNTAFAEGLPYFIKAGGRTYSGRVGPDLRLPRVDTAREDAYEVYVGDEALAFMDGAAS